jgi:ABC-type bacteriocin/lantibiotic exporter with double-glycine peptidase domain
VIRLAPHPQAKIFVPEVVQTSMMDCGPAALDALVAGFGISVNYGRLREACQTSVDGTSISTMDDVANLLGLETEETMLPLDHVLRPEAHALPAIVVVQNPNGTNHFIVVWSLWGPWVQVMDPAHGRHWIRRSALLDRLYVHYQRVPASAWRAWVAEREFLDVLDSRLAELAIERADRDRLCADALASPRWEEMSALDAATRMTASLVANRAIPPGPLCLALVERQVERGPDGAFPLLPLEYQSAWLSRVRDGDEEEMLRLRGVVLVRARGRRDTPRAAAVARGGATEAVTAVEAGSLATHDGESIRPIGELVEAVAPASSAARMPAELAAALTEQSSRPWRTLLGLLVADGIATPAVLCLAIVVSAIMVTGSAIVLRGVLEVGHQLGLPSQRAAAFAAVLGFLALGLVIELPLIAGALRLGRTLDIRLRMAFLAKIPRLDDRYFRSRLLSDMAERGHTLHLIRALPLLGVRLLSASAQLVLTVAGIAWLQPASAPLALASAAVCIGLPIVCQPVMAERDLRLRSHAAALGRFYLDALLGLLPIRVHGARAAMQRQQDTLLVQWARAGLRFYAASTVVEGLLALGGFGMAALMVWKVSSESAGSVLLLVYWALSLPALGQDVALVARQYPVMRNVVLRLLEPLDAPEPIEPMATRSAAAGSRPATGVGAAEAAGAAIRMSGVTVEAAGDTLLEDVDLDVAPGEHVAIVGPSGAGKSTLVGLLLGWYRPARGTLEVDAQPLVGDRLTALRRATAWVDPAVMLWNRSFLENLRYGAEHDAEAPLAAILTAAQLREVLERLPDGLATELGEGGALVSGGEGQRTRVGRALARTRARMVILDEPFRGLDRTTRRKLLATVRGWWRDATLLWVTHDITETEEFSRVLVIDGGRIVEDGVPVELGRRPGSRYAELVRGDRDMHAREWSGASWRRVWIERGRIREEGREA